MARLTQSQIDQIDMVRVNPGYYPWRLPAGLAEAIQNADPSSIAALGLERAGWAIAMGAEAGGLYRNKLVHVGATHRTVRVITDKGKAWNHKVQEIDALVPGAPQWATFFIDHHTQGVSSAGVNTAALLGVAVIVGAAYAGLGAGGAEGGAGAGAGAGASTVGGATTTVPLGTAPAGPGLGDVGEGAAAGLGAGKLAAPAPAAPAAAPAAGSTVSATSPGASPIVSTVSSQANQAAGGLFGSGSGILSSLDSTINGLAKDVSSFLQPITSVLDQVKQIAQDFNDKLILPVANIVTTTEQQYQKIVTSWHQDVKEGLAGLVKIPGQIAEALTSTDAAFHRAIQQMGLNNQGIVKDLLIPAFGEMGSKSLSHFYNALNPQHEPPAESPLFKKQDQLLDEEEISDFKDAYNKVMEFLKGDHGMFTPVLQFLYYLWFAGPFLVAVLENRAEVAKQVADSQTEDSLMAPGETIIAYRRGLIDRDALDNELSRQGYHNDRRQIMIDVAQYLFGPRDANELMRRGDIDLETYYAIASQNNMDKGQADALNVLLAFIFAPGDAAAALARGFITEEQYQAICNVNRLDYEQATLLKLLEVTPINTRSTLPFWHFEQALANGFLEKTLGMGAPDSVKEAYHINQVDPNQAEIDWKMHWSVPNPDWWVQAYFRKLRTKSECYQAFQIWGIPEETYDDQFTVRGELISAFILLEIIKAGVITEEQGRLIMQQQGMIPDQIEIMLQYSDVAGKTAKAKTADNLQKLSLSSAEQLYTDGAIDRDMYIQALKDHGFGEKAAKLQAELIDINLAQTQRKDYAQGIVDSVLIGSMSWEAGQAGLYDAGFTELEVNKYYQQILKGIRSRSKLPSESQLSALLKKGIIDSAEWLQTMELLGYSQDWAVKLLELEVPGGQ